MTSITTFAYGLTVRATDLVAASSAWPRLEPVFRFFDLVYLRRKRGSLAGSISSVSVPVEVWERVKRYLVVTEKEDAVDSIARAVLQPENCFSADCDEKPLKKRYDWDLFLMRDRGCFYCDERRYLWVDTLCDGNHEYHEGIQNLAATFGLAHPLGHFIRVDRETFADSDCVALISIPSRMKSGSQQEAATLGTTIDWDGPPQHTIATVDLSLPPDSDLRFLRFIQTFQLKVVDSAWITQSSIGPRTAAKARIDSFKAPEADQISGLEGVKNWAAVEGAPRWQLYTTLTPSVT